MIIEIGITLCVAFFIAVWFYKQRRESIELVQVEFNNSFTTLHELVEEKQPIVIRGCPFPPVLTQEKLAEIPRLDAFPLREQTPTLKDYRLSPGGTLPDEQAAGTPILSESMSRTLAHELAIDRWAEHTLKDLFTEFTGLIALFTSTRVSAILGGQGMKRATAIYTCILPTQGTYVISLVNKRSESFLPERWSYRYPESLTINDTPLVAEVQFIDVVVRPGTMLAIPAHCIFSMKPKEAGFSGAVILEIDTPISNLANLLGSAK